MVIHKLTDWEFEPDPYLLFAIHSYIQPYRMAYLLNKYAHLGFVRTDVDHVVLQSQCCTAYPLYRYIDLEENAPFYLIPNKHWGVSNKHKVSQDLFSDTEENQIKTVLIKEYKTVDFFLKIDKDPESFPIKVFVNQLSVIPQIASVYHIDTYKIKQQDYLIFD
jgi:hypothetical protein